MMLYVVFMIIFARSDEAKLRAGLSCRKETDFTRCVAGDREQKKGAAAGAFDIEAKTLVGFFVEQRVGLGCAQNVAIEAGRRVRGLLFDRRGRGSGESCPQATADRVAVKRR